MQSNTKQRLMCLAQGYNTVKPLRPEPATNRPRVKHSIPEHCAPLVMHGLGTSKTNNCDTPAENKCSENVIDLRFTSAVYLEIPLDYF